jgi:hypothetical protein
MQVRGHGSGSLCAGYVLRAWVCHLPFHPAAPAVVTRWQCSATGLPHLHLAKPQSLAIDCLLHVPVRLPASCAHVTVPPPSACATVAEPHVRRHLQPEAQEHARRQVLRCVGLTSHQPRPMHRLPLSPPPLTLHILQARAPQPNTHPMPRPLHTPHHGPCHHRLPSMRSWSCRHAAGRVQRAAHAGRATAAARGRAAGRARVVRRRRPAGAQRAGRGKAWRVEGLRVPLYRGRNGRGGLPSRANGCGRCVCALLG